MEDLLHDEAPPLPRDTASVDGGLPLELEAPGVAELRWCELTDEGNGVAQELATPHRDLLWAHRGGHGAESPKK